MLPCPPPSPLKASHFYEDASLSRVRAWQLLHRLPSPTRYHPPASMILATASSMPSKTQIPQCSPLPQQYIVPEALRPAVGHDEFTDDLPLIDFQLLRDGNAAVMEELARVAMEWGAFQVINHGIPENVLSNILAQNYKLISLPLEQKLKAFAEGTVVRYKADGSNQTDMPNLSWSESLTVLGTSQGTDLAKYARVLFPDDGQPEDFSRAYEEYFASNSKLSLEITGLLLKYLGVHLEHFAEQLKTPFMAIRMNYYPVSPDAGKTMGLGPHCDNTYVSSLYMNDVGGLQVLKDDRWLAVRPRADAMTILTGTLLEVVSNGIYQPVYHRVVNNGIRSRISINFAIGPDHGCTISAPPELKPHLYRPFTMVDYLSKGTEINSWDVRKFFKACDSN